MEPKLVEMIEVAAGKAVGVGEFLTNEMVWYIQAQSIVGLTVILLAGVILFCNRKIVNKKINGLFLFDTEPLNDIVGLFGIISYVVMFLLIAILVPQLVLRVIAPIGYLTMEVLNK